MPRSGGDAGKYVFGDARDEIRARAIASGLTFTLVDWALDDNDPDPYYLELDIPNGRTVRSVAVGGETAEKLLHSKFEHWVFLGQYNAILDKSSNSVEALIAPTLRGNPLRLGDLLCLPGAELLDRNSGHPIPLGTQRTLFDEDEFVMSQASLRRKRTLEDDETWRLVIQTDSSPISMQISETTQQVASIYHRMDIAGTLANIASLKMFGVEVEQHDQALAIMEDFAASLFFEMDLRFGIPLSLARKRLRRPVRRKSASTNREGAVELPRQKYAREAVSLYSYGRGALGTPLLQYLAYYQAIEFFFPSFFHAKLIGRVRNELRDIRFNKESDGDIQRILSIASQAIPRGAPEREQLRATFDACLDEGVVKQFISEREQMQTFLEKKNQIKDIPPISLKSNNRVIDQLVERVYSLRCRIVHTKEDGGSSTAEVLLPFSAEVSKMEHDLELMQFICQKVIIGGSRGVLWG
jgi:hypothetical protein